MTDLSWETLRNHLAADLTRLHTNDVIIFGPVKRTVQIVQHADHLMAEVISNLQLSPADQLSPQQERALADDGWQAPGPDDTWRHRMPFPPTSSQAAAAAHMIVAAIQSIIGGSPDDLQVTAWNYTTEQNLELRSLQHLRRVGRS